MKRKQDQEDPVAAYYELLNKNTWKMSRFGFESGRGIREEAFIDAPDVIDLREKSQSRQMKRLPRRGVLRKTAAVPTVSFEQADWQDETHLQHSPKIGPTPIGVSIAEKLPILGSYVDPSIRLKPEPKDDEEEARPTSNSNNLSVDELPSNGAGPSNNPSIGPSRAQPLGPTQSFADLSHLMGDPPGNPPPPGGPSDFLEGPFGPQRIRRTYAYADLSEYTGDPWGFPPYWPQVPPGEPEDYTPRRSRKRTRTSSGLESADSDDSPTKRHRSSSSTRTSSSRNHSSSRSPSTVAVPSRPRTRSFSISVTMAGPSTHRSGTSSTISTTAGPSTHRLDPSSSSSTAGSSRHHSSSRHSRSRSSSTSTTSSRTHRSHSIIAQPTSRRHRRSHANASSSELFTRPAFAVSNFGSDDDKSESEEDDNDNDTMEF